MKEKTLKQSHFYQDSQHGRIFSKFAVPVPAAFLNIIDDKGVAGISIAGLVTSLSLHALSCSVQSMFQILRGEGVQHNDNVMLLRSYHMPRPSLLMHGLLTQGCLLEEKTKKSCLHTVNHKLADGSSCLRGPSGHSRQRAFTCPAGR